MSMNLHLWYRDGNNKIVHKVDLLQTPTEITWKALGDKDPGSVYLSWVRDRWDDQKWIFFKEYQKLKDADREWLADYNKEWLAL